MVILIKKRYLISLILVFVLSCAILLFAINTGDNNPDFIISWLEQDAENLQLKKEEYDNYILQRKDKIEEICNSILAEYGDLMDDHEKELLSDFLSKIDSINSVDELDAKIEEFENFTIDLQNRRKNQEGENKKAEAAKQTEYQANYSNSQEDSPQDYTFAGNGENNSSNGDFKSQGIINQNGYRYSYYSSNVLRHYRTDEWTAGDDGIYRDSDGYVIAASDAHPQGSTVDTPFGKGKVYDTGVGRNDTIDIYTNY